MVGKALLSRLRYIFIFRNASAVSLCCPRRILGDMVEARVVASMVFSSWALRLAYEGLRSGMSLSSEAAISIVAVVIVLSMLLISRATGASLWPLLGYAPKTTLLVVRCSACMCDLPAEKFSNQQRKKHQQGSASRCVECLSSDGKQVAAK